ncbi:MAG TPA: DUF6494 family protein [Gemmatimonadales bacterium]|nr:DUF6494 family protein [Gemmatimonadales bacterium]
MNEEVFNRDLRKFLKQFGVTAQREIEKAVGDAIRSGRLTGREKLRARARLTVDGLVDAVLADGEIALEE